MHAASLARGISRGISHGTRRVGVIIVTQMYGIEACLFASRHESIRLSIVAVCFYITVLLLFITWDISPAISSHYAPIINVLKEIKLQSFEALCGFWIIVIINCNCVYLFCMVCQMSCFANTVPITCNISTIYSRAK